MKRQEAKRGFRRLAVTKVPGRLKRCPRCCKFQPLTSFSKDNSRALGVMIYCKSCDTTRVMAWKAANPERWNIYSRQYYERHKPYRLKVVLWKPKPKRKPLLTTEEKRQRKRQSGREYRQRNRAKRKAHLREYYKRNPELRRKHRGKGESFATQSWLWGDPCVYCGAPATTLEHIQAKATGGLDEWPNFAAACRQCNSYKCVTPLLLFLLERKPRTEAQAC